MKSVLTVLSLFLVALPSFAQDARDRLPVIDVHLHSYSLADLKENGANPISGVQPLQSIEEHIQKTVAAMKSYDIVLGIVSGNLESVEQFRMSAPEQIWAGPSYGIPGHDIDKLRALYNSGKLMILGEVCAQYDGLSPSDPVLAPYFALAEALDVSACIHMGMSFPGITGSCPKFRVSVGNPLLLEELLNHHPKLRVWIAHMGFPYLEETIGILNVYPQVYVDTSAIDWLEPGFTSYLKELIKYGFAKRIMFGSDQMTWPDAIGIAIKAIEKANFLSRKQKRDILYNNAARFLRLSPEQIAKHHRTSVK